MDSVAPTSNPQLPQTDPDRAAAAVRHKRLVLRNLPWNFAIHGIEGGLYMGGMQFIAFGTVGTVMIKVLAGPDWLIALMPIISALGCVIPQLFTAHKVEALRRHKPFCVVTGVFQRLPYLLAGLALIFMAHDYPWLTLLFAAGGPFFSGLAGGVSATAWQELVAKTIPSHRLSSIWAVRNIISAIVGLIASGVIAGVLDWRPGAEGFGWLHMIAFGFLVISYLLFIRIREVPYPPDKTRTPATLGQNLRQMPSLLYSDKRLRRYVLSEAFFAGQNIMIPFLCIHALSVLNQPNSFLGLLVGVQMISGIAGNIPAGWLGNRTGGKLPSLIGATGLVVMAAWAPFARTQAEFIILFTLWGVSNNFVWVGRSTLSIELCSRQRRATYLAVISVVSMFSMIICWQLSVVIYKYLAGGFFWVCAATAIALVASLAFLWSVREPRRDSSSAVFDSAAAVR